MKVASGWGRQKTLISGIHSRLIGVAAEWLATSCYHDDVRKRKEDETADEADDVEDLQQQQQQQQQ